MVALANLGLDKPLPPEDALSEVNAPVPAAPSLVSAYRVVRSVRWGIAVVEAAMALELGLYSLSKLTNPLVGGSGSAQQIPLDVHTSHDDVTGLLLVGRSQTADGEEAPRTQ